MLVVPSVEWVSPSQDRIPWASRINTNRRRARAKDAERGGTALERRLSQPSILTDDQTLPRRRLARQLEPLTAVLISINKNYKVRSGIRISGL